ncbi:hypothetical protein K457DRAFT_167442 [Linnemannia elongata AG-77]|uniref:Uncharacterized protein n=1 Tax=Linnemannia elongata AG-77 TaxID=1314771 RepID=A0A197KIP4_9FUNG|nr:hypothetical protein K457DRAFT_167442 [Linnemannia elongata AG-77]
MLFVDSCFLLLLSGTRIPSFLSFFFFSSFLVFANKKKTKRLWTWTTHHRLFFLALAQKKGEGLSLRSFDNFFSSYSLATQDVVNNR